MIPFGRSSATRAARRSWRTTWQKTLSSRTRRAISWAYCEPKSKTRTRSLSGAAAITTPVSLAAQFLRPLRGRLNGVDQRRPQAAAFECVQAGDRRPAGARYLVLEHTGVQPGFEYHP